MSALSEQILASLERPGRHWATVAQIVADVYGEGDRSWQAARARDVRRALRRMVARHEGVALRTKQLDNGRERLEACAYRIEFTLVGPEEVGEFRPLHGGNRRPLHATPKSVPDQGLRHPQRKV